MEEPNSPGDDEEVTALARQIGAGTDSISVPVELVDEAQTRPVAEQALWARIPTMSVAEKVKLALRGNKDARSILIRDKNKLIPRLVLQNPRITEDEILRVCRDRNTAEELLRTIADNRDWTRAYAVRLALVENARTPADKALKLLVQLGERDIFRLARNKDVPNIIVTRARRIMLQKQRR